MGMKIYDASGNFNPADYGLKTGDEINIICVGGGRGGSYISSRLGGNGATSSFGNIVSARGGSGTTGQFIIKDGSVRLRGGAGGFILGAEDWGGLPVSGSTYASPGSAGRSDPTHMVNKYQGIYYGAGSNRGGLTGDGEGGGGYGAGGGCTSGGWGGSSGEVRYATYKLTSLSAIPVLVGGGGGGAARGTQTVGAVEAQPGTTSGGGAGGTVPDQASGGKGGYGGVSGADGAIGGSGGGNDGGGGGAGGCVIVFW